MGGELLLWHKGISSILGAVGTQDRSPTWHDELGIQCCCSCGLGCDYVLIPCPGAPYAKGQPKVTKGKKKKEVWASLVPSVGSEGESVPCTSPGFWPLPTILGIPWLVATSFQSLCFHFPVAIPAFYLCLFWFLVRILVEFRAHF